MDNVTHTLIGALIGEGASRLAPPAASERLAAVRRTLFLLVMIVGSNLPDSDLIYSLGDDDKLPYLLEHRGHTHTVLGAIAGSAVMVAACAWWQRWRRARLSARDWVWLSALALAAPLLHIAMDALNTYGVHPWWPVDNRWFYGDSVFIVEPLFWASAASLAFLFRSLVARGIVVDAEDKAIAGATITLPDETLCATANEQGAFTCELPDRLPEALVVSSSGYAPRELEIVRETLGNGVDFGRVRLFSGRSLTLKIVRPEPVPARVSLFLDAPRYEHSKLKTISIKEREESVRFDAAAGNYFVVVEGEGPLERLEVPIVVKDENVEHEIKVEPFRLVGTARFGEDPFEGAIEIVSRENTWRERLPVTNGAFSATMWQSGEVLGWLNGDAIKGSELLHSPKLGEDPSRWDIRIEKRMIAGRVLDAATKAAVPDAHIDVMVESEGSKGYFSAEIEPDGSYQILANKPGTYTLRVGSKQYMPYNQALRITTEDRIRTHDVLLERGVLQPIDVMRPAGAAVQATMLEGVRSDGVNPEIMAHTDEQGHFDLRGLPGQSRLLYVIPRDGSFAVARVSLPAAGAEPKPMQIIVPPAVGGLRVRSVDSEGKQRPAAVLIRYNGEFVPGAILRFVTGEMGTGHTGEALLPRLPAGTYELWALMSRDDELRLIASNGTLREPVRVGLSSGEQAVTVVAPTSASNERPSRE